MDRYVKRDDVYALFDRSGMANLHVADIDVIQDADVVPVVHGQWEEIFWGNMSFSKCSNCGSKVQWFLAKEFIYCPFCGVKMEGE